MKKGEKVLLTVKPQCKFLPVDKFVYCLLVCTFEAIFGCSFSYTPSFHVIVDAFGEKGKAALGDEGAVPPNATLEITLELVSWKTVTEVTDDKKVIKKTLKKGEAYERPNEGAIVKCQSYSPSPPLSFYFFFYLYIWNGTCDNL